MAIPAIQEGTVVAVLRICRACGEVKPLEHFLIHRGTGEYFKLVGDVKVCAACRRGRKEQSA